MNYKRRNVKRVCVKTVKVGTITLIIFKFCEWTLDSMISLLF